MAPHDCETDLRKRRRNRQKGFDVFVDRIETGETWEISQIVILLKQPLSLVPESFVSSLYMEETKGRWRVFYLVPDDATYTNRKLWGAYLSQWSRIRKRLANSCVNTQRFSKQNMGRSSKINGSTCSLKYKNKQKQIGLIV